MTVFMVIAGIAVASFAAGIGLGVLIGMAIGTFSTADYLKYGFAPAADGATSKEKF